MGGNGEAINHGQYSTSLLPYHSSSVAGSRRGIGVNEERDQTLNQLLTELDGFEGREGVLLLAATNRAEVGFLSLCYTMLHYAMLRYAMLRSAMLCCAVPCPAGMHQFRLNLILVIWAASCCAVLCCAEGGRHLLDGDRA